MNTARQHLLALSASAVFLSAGVTHAATTLNYTYDDLNRLKTVVRGDGPSLSYTYDEVGNITLRTATNPDTDGDGLTDIVEVSTFGTNPSLSDTDIDGLSDYAEVCHDGNCSDYNPYDPITNLTGTDLNANKTDTDGDGVTDADELTAGTNPLDPASHPVMADGDINGDGLVNVVDVMLAQRIIVGTLLPTSEQIMRGDVAPLVNGVPAPNGIFDLGDLVVIQRKALGQINF